MEIENVLTALGRVSVEGIGVSQEGLASTGRLLTLNVKLTLNRNLDPLLNPKLKGPAARLAVHLTSTDIITSDKVQAPRSRPMY